MQRWTQNDPAKDLRWSFFRKSLLGSERKSESSQTSKKKLFAKIANNEKPPTGFVKTTILDVWQGSVFVSQLASKVTDVSFLNQFEYQRVQITYWEKPKIKSQSDLNIVERKCC